MAAGDPGVDARWVGRRILATYGHRTAALVDADRLIAIPDGVPDDLALLAILAADTGHAVERAALAGHERCLILGAGALGLLTLLNLQRAGFGSVTMVDVDSSRLDPPARLGARVVPFKVCTKEGSSFDVAFECSASPAAFATAQQLLGPGGKLIVVSDGNGGDLTLTPDFHEKELVVRGSNSHPDLRTYAAPFLAAAATSAFDAYSAIFDTEVAFDDLPSFFARMASGGRVRKPLVRCG